MTEENAGRFIADQKRVPEILMGKTGVVFAASYDFGHVVSGRRRKSCSIIVELDDGTTVRRERISIDSIKRLTFTGPGKSRSSWTRRDKRFTPTAENAARILEEINPDYHLAAFHLNRDRYRSTLQVWCRHYGFSCLITWKNFIRDINKPQDPFAGLKNRIKLESLANQAYEAGTRICGVFRGEDDRTWVQLKTCGKNGSVQRKRAQNIKQDADQSRKTGQRIALAGRERRSRTWLVGVVVCMGPVEGGGHVPYIKIGLTRRVYGKKATKAFTRRYNSGGRRLLWVDSFVSFSSEKAAIDFEDILLKRTAEHRLSVKALPEGWTECREMNSIKEVQNSFRELCAIKELKKTTLGFQPR